MGQCKHCGSEVKEGMRFCGNCGAPQEAEAAEKKKKEEAEQKKKALKDKVKSAGNKLLDRISGRSAEKSGEKQ